MIRNKRNFFLTCLITTNILSLNNLNTIALGQNKFKNVDDLKESIIPPKKNDNTEAYSYRLGPGDTLFINFYGLPEFSKTYFVGPDGKIFLPEMKYVFVENMTIEELDRFLNIKFKEFLIEPKIDVYISTYRPVRVYVKGEVARPGFYTLSGIISDNIDKKFEPSAEEANKFSRNISAIINPSERYSNTLFPTVFDAIKASQGVTPYSDLSNVEVIRRRGYLGSEKIKANLNFLELITEGDQSQNIRVLDGDTIIISKSKNILKEQIASTLKTNISPDIIEVYVTGNVISPGLQYLPSGSALNQALAQAGGKKILSGRLEFLRFNDEFNIDKRRFSYNLKAKRNSYQNPILMNGDIINVQKSILGTTTGVVAEFSKPIVGIYSLYNLFDWNYE